MHQISLWSWSLEDDPDPRKTSELVLSEEERARAQRFLSPRHQQRFIAARLQLRTILGAHVGVAPGKLVFAENKFGKPRLVGHQIHFNLSHSEDHAVLAVSNTLEIGVDLERIRDLEHLELARDHFCASEVATIEALPPSERLLAFYQTWTLKEAVVKAVGKGLSIPLSDFEVAIAKRPPRLIACPDAWPPADAWDLHLFEPVAHYVCGLAAPGGGGAGLIHRTC